MNLRAPSKKVAVLLFDADDCIYTQDFEGLQNSQEAEIGALIIEKHALMLAKQIQKLREGNYDKVIIANFSVRQSIASDKASQKLYNKPSCIFISPVLQNYFQKNLKCEVVIDPLWSSDIIFKREDGSPKQAGDTYFAAIKDKNKPKTIEKQIGDITKSILFYLHCQRAAALHPEADQIHLSFFDDNYGDIISPIKEIFTENLYLLPKNCTATLVVYFESIMEEEFTFTGTGPIITAYDWAFRYLCIFLGDMINFKQDAPLSDQLEQFHQENGYFKRQDFYRFYGDLIKSKNLSDFNKSLQAFSEMKPIIGTGYTTAIELCDKDLISQALIGKNSETHEKEQPQGKISTEKEKRYSLYDMPCCFLRQSLRSEKPQTIEETTSTTLGSVRK